MKRKTLTLIAIILMSFNVYSQSPEANFDDDIQPAIGESAGAFLPCNCSITNTRYHPVHNIPFSNSPVKKVRVELNVFQNGSGGGNFINDPNSLEEGMPRLLNFFNWTNNYYNTNLTNSLPPGGISVSDLPKEYIQLESGGIYFYNDPVYFRSIDPTSLYNYIKSDPTRTDIDKHIQVFFTQGFYKAKIGGVTMTNRGSGYTSTPTITVNPPGAVAVNVQVSGGEITGITFSGGAYNSNDNPGVNYGIPTITISGGGGSGATAAVKYMEGASGFAPIPNCDFALDSYVVLLDSYREGLPFNSRNQGDYATSTVLAHEFGHVFGLIHTYTGGGTSANCTSNGNDPMYLNDVYGQPAPGNCPHDVSWDCGPIAGLKLSNNMMGGTQCAGYFSPKQIGIMHRSLKYNYVRKYLKECYYDNLNPLTISSNEIWDMDVQWDRDLIVENGATVDLICKLSMPQASSITVKSGGVLNVDAIITNNCDNGWNGILRVEAGGVLKLRSNSKVELIGNGKILIENDGGLEYYENANIKLTGPNAILEIAGTLDIKDDAVFTFSYDNNNPGFVRFNHTANFPSRNIIAGNNSSISLSGISISRKILEINQETMYGPAGLTNFSVSNGKVELHSGSRLQADGLGTAITFVNVRFTSHTSGTNNGHRGLHLYGQQNVSIDNCIFEYGTYGIYGWLSYGGSALTVSNSVFRHNTWGIRTFDKGLNLLSCHFFNNDFGVMSRLKSFPSYFYGGTVGGSVAGKNDYGIYWTSNSSGSLILDNPFVNTNDIGATIYGTPLYIKCGSVSFNDIGLNMNRRSSLFMNDMPIPPSQTDIAGVTALNNNYTIKTELANYLYLDKGNNNLSPSGQNNQSTVNGTLMPGGLFPIPAHTNQWNNFGGFSSSDYLLTVSTRNEDLDDGNPLSSTDPCGQALPPCTVQPCNIENPLEYCPVCEEINTDDFVDIPLNEATSTAIDLFYANTPDNFRDAISLFTQILLEDYDTPGPEEEYLLNLNYTKMMEALGYAFSTGQITEAENETGFCTEVESILEVHEKMMHESVFKDYYDRRIGYAMDKAQTFRISGRRDLCLNELNDILNWVESEEDETDIENFQCIVSLEKDLIDSAIDFESEDISLLMENCEGNSSNQRVRHVHATASKNVIHEHNKLEVRISPNPSKGIVNISTNCESGQLHVMNSLGEIVYRSPLNYEQSADLSSLPKGLYFITIIHAISQEYSVHKISLQ